MTNQTAAPDLRTIVSEFTAFEITALLSVIDTESAARTLELLHLPAVEKDSPAVGIGLSTLIARGKITTTGGLMPVGDAARLAGLGGTATTWIETVTITGDRKSVAVFVSAPEGTVFLEPAPFGLWLVWPVKPGVSAERAAAGYVGAAFEKAAGAPFGGSVEATRLEGPVRTAAVKVDDAGTWRLQAGELDRPEPPRQIAADPTFAVLAEAIAG
ncbi:hypothetical protein [Myceligenerans crystallogenes]|uniref:Uncharacterized protein n=1 Tax=Myceligenerans crystallogenes TaxID=316335 RepID=A0ABN2N2U7_9MICO